MLLFWNSVVRCEFICAMARVRHILRTAQFFTVTIGTTLKSLERNHFTLVFAACTIIMFAEINDTI